MKTDLTINELWEQERIRASAQEYEGHKFAGHQRFDDERHHMIILDVLQLEKMPQWDSNKRKRFFVTNADYKDALECEKKGYIKIVSHARVLRHGYLLYDSPDTPR